MLEQPVINLITTPLVAGVVGYITNKIAIKMLFRPYEPKWYTLGWQGIVPKTRPKLAVKISEIVGQKLLAHDDFLYALENNDCDMISLSRPFIRQPDLVNKIQQGKIDHLTCKSCNRCFFHCIAEKPMKCLYPY